MWYGHAPVENGCLRSRARVGALAAAAACVAVAVPGGRADDPAALRAAAGELRAAEQQAALRLFAVETATTRARAHAEELERRVRQLDEAVRASRRYQAIASASLSASHARVARLLRTLYVEGPPADALAVLLGADSLDAAIEAVDSLRFAVEQNRRLAREAARRRSALRVATDRLRTRAAALRRSRAQARDAVRELELVTADRVRVLSRLRARRSLTEQRLAVVETAAAEAARRAAEIQAATARRTEAAAAPATGAVAADASATGPVEAPEATPAPVGADRQLVVSSTAYSLGGRTASGLPVGPGIIAVDPTVIPLGTRVYVPGYGTAVAADTGSAVRGNVIDVWLPSLAGAQAWGRRTVTITIYRS